MLEVQKARIYERTRLRAKGVPEDEIAQMQNLPFKPAFVNGKRKKRETGPSDDAPALQLASRQRN
ncbi:MAG TPA: hypothetical protein PLB55_10745 [Prosthecobacter sp.]|jgi:hypothetical protein|nr:hypothetical protein [Prosthecobacter sp.]